MRISVLYYRLIFLCDESKKTRFFAKSVRSGLFTTVVAQFFCFVFFGWYLLCWCHRVISLTSSFNSWSQFWYAWFVVSESKGSNEKMKGEEARELKGSLTFTTRPSPIVFSFDLCLAFARPCLLRYKPQRKNTPPKTACCVGYSDLAEGKQSDVTNKSPIRHPVLTRYITLCSNLDTWPLRWKANSADLFTKFCRSRELHDCYVMLHPGPRAIIFMHFHFRNIINFPIVFLIVSC